MKKQIEMIEDGKQFERFDALLSQILTVPKSEIDRREKEEKQLKKERKTKKVIL